MRWTDTQSSACSFGSKLECGTLHKPHRGMQSCDVSWHENRLAPGSRIESHNMDRRQIVFSIFQLPMNTSAGLCRNGGDPESAPSPMEENQVALR